MLKKAFDYFLFTSLFIALCAVVMVLQTNQLLRLHYDQFAYLGFVFSSTICSYNFHWYLTPNAEGENDRAQWTRNHKALHIILFLAGVAGSAWFFFQLLYAWFWLFVPVALTFLYSAPKIPHRSFHVLRKIAIGKTIFLSFVWMYVTTLMPVLLHEGPIGESRTTRVFRWKPGNRSIGLIERSPFANLPLRRQNKSTHLTNGGR